MTSNYWIIRYFIFCELMESMRLGDGAIWQRTCYERKHGDLLSELQHLCTCPGGMEVHLRSRFQGAETRDPQARQLATIAILGNSGFNEGTLTQYFWWTVEDIWCQLLIGSKHTARHHIHKQILGLGNQRTLSVPCDKWCQYEVILDKL